MLHKPVFDCTKIGDFYDCGCADEDEELEEKKGEKSHAGQTTQGKATGHNKDQDWEDIGAVEISKEP